MQSKTDTAIEAPSATEPDEASVKILPTGPRRFVELAARGAYPGASGGEKIANRLAVALFYLGDDLAVIDSPTLEGAFALMRGMSGPWPTDEVKQHVFQLVRQAAGK